MQSFAHQSINNHLPVLSLLARDATGDVAEAMEDAAEATGDAAEATGYAAEATGDAAEARGDSAEATGVVGGCRSWLKMKLFT